MGNLIGAREGVYLLFPGLKKFIVPILGILAAMILYIPSLKFISRLMGILVMVLGVVFLYAAVRITPPADELIKGIFIPSMPSGTQAPWLALALIGTTIVPYNLFLGSGLSKGGMKLSEMRLGLIVAIMLGGVFSLAVVIVGTAIQTEFSFSSLSEALSLRSGVNGKLILGIGLFAAGFTSAITAPLASAITLKSLFGNRNKTKWGYSGLYFRLSWLAVLLIGVTFATFDIRPIPAIIFAQAMNGIMLPLISFILVYLIHDPRVTRKTNSPLNSLFLGITLFVTVIIGLNNLVLAFTKVLNINVNRPGIAIILYVSISFLITGGFYLFLLRRNSWRNSNFHVDG
jgi:Mn2+/Fe2+ NRAMP family transporter